MALIASTLGAGSVPRTIEFWNWKHRHSPFGASPGLVAEADGRIVGLRVFLRWRWQSGGDSLTAVRAVDTATHPGWQGQGIFRQLTQQLVEQVRATGAAFVFNTPNRRSRRGYLRMGWSEVARLPALVRLLQPVEILIALTRSDSSGEPQPLELDRLPTVGCLLTEDGLASFLDRVEGEENRFHTVRNLDYLRWRYVEVPGVRYRALWEWQDKSGGVIIVRSRLRRGMRELAVCEILAPADSRSSRVVKGLLTQLIRNSGADYILALGAPRTPERRALTRAGFLPLPKIGPYFTVRTLNTGLTVADPTSWRSWRLSVGDLELF